VVRSVRATLQAEQDRQHALEAVGVRLVRWGAGQIIQHPDAVAGRIQRAVLGRDGRELIGRAVPSTALSATQPGLNRDEWRKPA
jgi:hypothetical protein